MHCRCLRHKSKSQNHTRTWNSSSPASSRIILERVADNTTRHNTQSLLFFLLKGISYCEPRLSNSIFIFNFANTINLHISQPDSNESFSTESTATSPVALSTSTTILQYKFEQRSRTHHQDTRYSPKLLEIGHSRFISI